MVANAHSCVAAETRKRTRSPQGTVSLGEYIPLVRREDAGVGPVVQGAGRRATIFYGTTSNTLAQQSDIKLLSDNRSAGHNFHLLDRYEAGMVLTGTEVKSAKSGKIQLKESYAEVSDGEAWLMNAHISEYSHGNIMNHVPVRKRKLLLHRSEIDKLQVETREKGLTLVPTRLYLKSGKIKVEIAVAKGKKFHDKREATKAREMDAEAKAAVARRARQ
jgi:SsrA-binding protein